MAVAALPLHAMEGSSAATKMMTPLMQAAGKPVRKAEDFAIDVSKLMDTVREEILALMLDGAQKSASFCASLCAEKIVAARREMQRQRMEERRELERLYGIPAPRGRSTSPAAPVARSRAILSSTLVASAAGAAAAASDVAALHTSSLPNSAAALATGGGCLNAAASRSPRAVGSGRAATPPPPLVPSFVGGQWQSLPAAGTGAQALGSHAPARAATGGSAIPPAPRSLTAAAATPPAPPEQLHENGGLPPSGGTLLSNSFLAEPPLGGTSSAAYDATYIDAYDAVQTYEEKVNMAARAMDLLDQALQGLGKGTGSVGKGSPSSAAAPAVAAPRGSSASPNRQVQHDTARSGPARWATENVQNHSGGVSPVLGSGNAASPQRSAAPVLQQFASARNEEAQSRDQTAPRSASPPFRNSGAFLEDGRQQVVAGGARGQRGHDPREGSSVGWAPHIDVAAAEAASDHHLDRGLGMGSPAAWAPSAMQSGRSSPSSSRLRQPGSPQRGAPIAAVGMANSGGRDWRGDRHAHAGSGASARRRERSACSLASSCEVSVAMADLHGC
eukprot:TRINITY_DN2722_c0_g2_i1.p1 TRINITY_DN2722_c0_g2~~TRINITY_DN2722_c0_g2_i1.p1  ORF type:complete len:560 (-),score=101.10 TRINITY_DN2722_c0_g2_i1:219-1898(-)